ncbi:M48 family metallopeptidase [Jannaschia formosa]|uniref:M48 family metallopeptidase n=1 Tax=Jannaschia formosa TaxID=2259592 RepID=UPI000E1C20FC|nr:SprT family zinc-dependent metalloprotease [Jannaschia formosa]TFL18350.1 M48 family peptidase [Jannaschia formosa]
MPDTIALPGLPGVTVAIRRSGRARRLSLRVGRTDGAVTLTLPARTPLAEGRAFVAAQAGWIARQVAAAPTPRRVAIGGVVPLLGREVPVVAGQGRAARWTGTEIAVPEDPQAGTRVQALLREMARSHLTEAVDRHAAAIGRSAGRITLRDTRSRWGSCTSRGDLMFSWRLVMAPAEVLDYVAAHEVAHLVHMDHSPRFWAQVGAICPDWKPRRDWLRREGAGLHAIRFDAVPEPAE